MKRNFIILLFLLISSVSFSQQLPQFRNSYFNMLTWNPASIAFKEMPEIMINHRSQWSGFSGAPRMSTLAGKYLFREDMGAGAYIMSDVFGITQKLNFALDYAYLLRTGNINISFGIAWTLTQYKLFGTRISILDANDQVINQNLDDKTWKPDANIGIMVGNEDFYAGFSISQLFKSKYIFFQSNTIPGLIQDNRHFFINGGYNFFGDQKLHRFTPFLNNYFSKGTPYKFDLGLNYSYQNTFFSSLYLSKGDAMVFSAGYKFDKFIFSYSFDFITSRIRNVSSGAHEITIGMYLSEKQIKNNGSSPMF